MAFIIDRACNAHDHGCSFQAVAYFFQRLHNTGRGEVEKDRFDRYELTSMLFSVPTRTYGSIVPFDRPYWLFAMHANRRASMTVMTNR